MSKEDVIIDTKIKYKGVFDLEFLYSKLRDWLLSEGYSDPCDGGEKKYSEKIKPNGKQLEIIWESSKTSENGYFKTLIKISFYVNGLNEVEAERDGKNIKLDKAEIEIKFSSSAIRNSDDSWNENGMIFRLYEKFIVRDKIEETKIICYKDTMDLIDETKNFLNLYSF